MLSFFLLSAVLMFFIVLVATVFAHMLFLVPYVPSKKRVMAKMIRVAKLKAKQTVYDLGCGDGRLLLAAEKTATVKTFGFEIAPLMFLFAFIRKIFSRSKMKLQFQNLFSADLRKANIIFCYLFPNVMPRLAEKIKQECKKGTRIVSNTFHIPGLKEEKVYKKEPGKGIPTIYVYKI